LAHLVPSGTPYALMPFIVLIELTRNIIRPLTLSVRLAANIVAGHLLLTLLRVNSPSLTVITLSLIVGRLVLLCMLETAVAIIQAYVFSVLRTLYLNEVNSTAINH
jgi:F-type H+-transporting ATPase subunit a